MQLNVWIPDPPPRRDPEREGVVRDFLGHWGPSVPAEAGDAVPPDFDAQCEAMLGGGAPDHLVRDRVVSSSLRGVPQGKRHTLVRCG